MLRGHARCGVAGWVSRMYRNTWGTCGAGQGRYTCTCAVGGVVYERTAPHSGSSAPGARFALECGGATVLSCPDVRRELQLALECLRASSQDSSRRTATHSGRVHPPPAPLAPTCRTFSFNSSHCSRGGAAPSSDDPSSDRADAGRVPAEARVEEFAAAGTVHLLLRFAANHAAARALDRGGRTRLCRATGTGGSAWLLAAWPDC